MKGYRNKLRYRDPQLFLFLCLYTASDHRMEEETSFLWLYIHLDTSSELYVASCLGDGWTYPYAAVHVHALCHRGTRARSQALASHSEQIWGGGVSQS